MPGGSVMTLIFACGFVISFQPTVNREFFRRKGLAAFETPEKCSAPLVAPGVNFVLRNHRSRFKSN